MFQGLKNGAQIYVLFRQEPRVATGTVTSVGEPTPIYNVNAFPGNNFLPPKYTFDIKAEIEGKEYSFNKLPGELSTFGYANNSTVISDTREGIISEVEALRNTSAKILQEIDSHKAVVSQCDKMLAQLNPQLKREAEQAEEIARLKQGVESLHGEISDIKNMLSQAFSRDKNPKEE